ncbi:MAG: DUF167 domain-containing protein [Acidimicrobiia bacterium]|nr:DUF167 domain-containing protein [Acidimicrobiia bacterium]
MIEARGEDSVVHVRVHPRAGRTEVVGSHGDSLKLRVSEPPVDGRATEAARRAVAGAFGLPASRVEVVSGERSRAKVFRLVGLPADEAAHRLGELLA